MKLFSFVSVPKGWNWEDEYINLIVKYKSSFISCFKDFKDFRKVKNLFNDEELLNKVTKSKLLEPTIPWGIYNTTVDKKVRKFLLENIGIIPTYNKRIVIYKQIYKSFSNEKGEEYDIRF